MKSNFRRVGLIASKPVSILQAVKPAHEINVIRARAENMTNDSLALPSNDSRCYRV